MIKVCHDVDAIHSFMSLPEISYYAAEHGAKPEKYDFDKRHGWLQYEPSLLLSLQAHCNGQTKKRDIQGFFEHTQAALLWRH